MQQDNDFNPQETESPVSGIDTLPKKSTKFSRLIISVVVFVIVILVIIGVVLFLNYKSSNSHVATVTDQTTAAAQVNISASGFVPATISVKSDQDVEWLNQDSKPHVVASDPYPTDNTLAGLNSEQSITSGASYNYIFKTPGIYTYHDNLNPSLKGTVIVQ
jgi:plastocyanin